MFKQRQLDARDSKYQINSFQPMSASKNSLSNMQIEIKSPRNIEDKKLTNRQSSFTVNNNQLKTIGQKKRALFGYRYINQLARLDFEDKEQQIYTKYTKVSKVTIMKKIQARNQIAEFEDEDEGEQIGYDQLLEFKFGKEPNSVYFEKDQMAEYDFCPFCDTVHNDHKEVHIKICERVRSEEPLLYSPYSQNYRQQSLKRLRLAIGKINGNEYEQLLGLVNEIHVNDRREGSWVVALNQLKSNFQNDTILCKIIDKTLRLLAK